MNFGNDVTFLREVKLELPNNKALSDRLEIDDLDKVLFTFIPLFILWRVCNFFDEALDDIGWWEDTQHGIDVILIDQFFI